MPIGFNSPARNFFLLGSSGIQTATNFFKAIDQSATTDGFFSATGIKYSSYDEKYILSGSADNSQATSFGYLEKREEDGTLDWNNRIQSAVPSGKLDLTSLELDTNGDLIVGGLSNSAPWIAKYSNTGGLVWQSTTNTGDVRYFGIGIDSSNNYYAAGRTERNDLSNPSDTNRSNAVVEKYDSNGNSLWGKSVSIGAENASFQKVDANDTSVICAGYIEDNVTKGYFAKYDSASGVLQWDRTLESKEISGLGIQEKTSIEDIHVDSDGFIYLCGVLSFGEVESNTFNQSRGFITKYTPEGNQLWCREVGIPNFTAYVQYYNIKVDDNTKQVIVFGISSNTNSTRSGLLTKLSSSGEILWHRKLLTDRVPPTLNEFQRRVGFDADASFYYIFFTDDDFNKVSGNPDEYTFGKVSSSGNGLGSFVYNPEVGIDIEYTIANIPDRIGKLQDGSVRNDSSDFISYPFNGTKIMFDDLATPVTNKKAIISDKDIILRSGSPVIRPVDFQELNLLGDVYSGSGNWLDQSGKGNDGVVNGATHNAAGYWEFDRTDDYISVDTLPDDFDTITVEMWTTLNQSVDPPYYRAGILKSSNANWSDGFGFFEIFNPNTNARTLSWFVNAWNGSQTIAVDVSSSEYTQFTHWVGTYDGSNMKLYKNGVLLDTSAYTDAIVNSDKPLFIGGGESTPYQSAAGGDYFWWWDGDIGDVRIYPRALTAAQAFQNYNATKSKYINEAPDTAPKIGPGIVYNSNLLLNYDFGNRATYDPAENIVPNSQNKTGWNQVRGTIADVDIVAPDGTSGAFLFTESTETGPHHFKIPYNTGGSDYGDEITWSSQLYFKRYGSKNRIRFGLNTKDDTYRHLLFDFTTGQVENEYSISGTYSVDNVGGGWYRINLTDNGDTGSTRPHAVMSCFMIETDTTSTSSYTGDGESGVYFWGPNLKIGSTSRYIKTYGSAITAPTTVKNLSSNSFPGTINGAEFDTDGYFDFDGPPGLGAGDYINIGTTSTFNWIHDRTESGWAIEGWYLNDRDEEYGALISNNSGTSTVGFYMGQRNDSLFECVINEGTAGTPACSVLSTNVLDHNTWYHIMFVNENYTIKLYVNGVLQSNAGDQNSFSTGSTADAQTDLRIAKLADSPTWNLDGEIGEVRIYQSSLSATEVLQNFNATRGKYGV